MSNPRIGVFVCHCGSNIGATVDVPAVTAFAGSLDNVVYAQEHKYMCSDPGQEMIRDAIKENQLDRVVVASCSPLMHEPTFRNTCEEAGLNGYLFQMANLREQVSWVTEDKAAATEKAKTVVRAAVQRVADHTELHKSTKPCTPATLVIGGGVAGIEAALQVASSDTKVYLVEREPSIGGAMAKFDKTFPTLDCAACILTPKMVSAYTHPNITVMAYSEVVELSGYVGNFEAKIHHKASYVNNDKCTGCGACLQKCPQKRIPHEWEQNLMNRRAIYTPFAQAVPNKPVIDAEHCTKLTKDKCGICARVCEADAIEYDQDPAGTYSTIEIGNIIVATGMKTFDPTPMKALGYGRIPDVYTALEFERMCHASGPTEGHVVKKTDGVLTQGGVAPRAVALIHCIGSRDKNYNEHCSRVCCMYSLKYAHLIKEHVPGCEVYDFYIDMRCFGKGYEEFYNRLLGEDVRFVRGKVAEVINWAIYPEEEGRLVVRVEDTLVGSTRRIPVDMVVLGTGLEPAEGAKDLAQTLHMSCSSDGFYLERHPKLAPVSTASEGIFVAGCCQGPKDIPDSVAQGAAAAAQAIAMIKRGTVEIEPTTAHVIEDLCSGCQICIPLCPYEAITRDEERRLAVIEPAKCKGCGTCVGACPSSALQQWGFDDKQIYAELEGLLA